MTIPLIMLALLSHPVCAQDQTAEDSRLANLLRDALFAEEADQDGAKAEKGYREILRRFDSERSYAATATLRLGDVLAARGEIAEAKELYSRVLREFADQTAVVQVARARLGDEAVERLGGEAELTRLQKMLAESPDLLHASVKGVTPLARAAGAGELEVVNYLLEKGAAVEGERSHRRFGDGQVVWTPLGRAVTGGHLEVVEALLGAGAQLPDGVLHTAVAVGNLAVTERLLKAGADPNAPFGSSTLLYDPAQISNPVGIRLPPNPRPGDTPKNFYTPLEIAAEKGFREVAKLLLESGVDFTIEGAHSRALLAAVNRGDAALVNSLLGVGADANGPGRGRSGQSLLHNAAGRGAAEIVKLLLDSGAVVDAKAQGDNTPLHWASAAAVPVLLEAGADPNARNEQGYTPLFIVGGEDGGDKVRALVAAGADVNASTDGGYSPLLSAAEAAALPGAKALVEAGAEVKHVAKFGGAISCAVPRGGTEIIKFLASVGAEVDALDEHGASALFKAVGNNNAVVVEALLQLGADPDGPDGAMPPLGNLRDLATSNLRNRGATTGASGTQPDPNVTNFERIVRLLVDAGAAPDALDGDGQTALYKATKSRQTETVDYLLAKGASAIDGKDPAFKLITNIGPPEELALKSKLFIAAQRDAPDRARMLRCTSPSHANPFAEISAGVAEGDRLPACSYSLFEVYAFSTVFVSTAGPVRIWRMGEAEPIEVDLAKAWGEADPAGDLPLQWGDVVEFTGSAGDDRAGQPVSDKVRQELEKRLARKVEFVWRADAEGEETRRQAITFYPGWQQAKVGRGWVLGGANGYSIVEGESEVSVLPTLGRLAWKDGDARVEPERWVIERKGADGESYQFAIGGSSRYGAFPIPEDGDIIVMEGREPAQESSAAATAAAQLNRAARAQRRRVVLPPNSR